MTTIIDPLDIDVLGQLPAGAADLLIVIVGRWTQAEVEAVTQTAASKLKPEGGKLIIASNMAEALEQLV
jgi:hypothetical protein